MCSFMQIYCRHYLYKHEGRSSDVFLIGDCGHPFPVEYFHIWYLAIAFPGSFNGRDLK